MLGVSLQSLGHAIVTKWSEKSSFLCHSVRTGCDILENLSILPVKSTSGWVEMVCHFHLLTSIQKIPGKTISFCVAIGKADTAHWTLPSGKKVIVNGVDLGAKFCSLITATQIYSAKTGLPSIAQNKLTMWKIALHFIKSFFKFTEHWQKIAHPRQNSTRKIEILKATNHGVRAASQAYRFCSLYCKYTKFNYFIILFRGTGVGLDIAISYLKQEHNK